ncbi:hypothetical protein DSO57_1027944 [Entomophthora muscae]|uniref:Uncharacterized protein n=1 Tax=Entomophthora muscae TaxID=34485 RepID=A0ACC2T1M7_9FUNG|nr:hypothetical protein DSO57_1027944 [Entomophthora muscae]
MYSLPLSYWLFTLVLLSLSYVVDSSSSIFNGKGSHTPSYLFVVGLRDKLNPAVIFCSGSLLSANIVLTAGHCIYNYYPQDILVVQHSNEGISETSVVSLFTHPKFHAGSREMSNDVGLLLLQEEPSKSSDIFPEIDGENLSSKIDLGLTIAGWGAFEDGGASASTLQYADVQVLSFSKCQKTLGTLYQLSQIGSFCAGDLYGLYDACQGDSGGPALATVSYQNKSKLIQVGIVSLGGTCGLSNTAAVYTRVFQYKEWIDSMSKIHPPA